jgi:predicted MFS family arabinose efflux permease
MATPVVSLLAPIVHKQGGSIIGLGLLISSASLGALLGAWFAGSRGEGLVPVRRYAWFGIIAAAAIAVFAVMPVGLLSPLPLAVVGFVLFAEAVWNTSRVRLLAAPAFQARLQAVTSMAFTLGGALGQLWGGIVLDQFGLISMMGGAGLLGAFSLLRLLTLTTRPAEAVAQ